MPEEFETVDAEVVPVAAEPRTLEPVRRALPSVSVGAAVAATGFAAGVVTVTAVQRRRTRKALGSRQRRGVLGTVVASRSFLVDVHMLGNR